MRKKSIKQTGDPAAVLQGMVSPRLSDLLATIKSHPWVRTCKVCGKDCSREAITKLIYTHEACGCDAALYRHLVENIYHAKCYVKRANEQAERSAGKPNSATK